MISEKAVKQLVLCFIAILAITIFTGYRLGKLDSSIHQNKVTMDKDFKPDWNEAPDWAEFLAQDNDGSWYWFEEQPVLNRAGKKWVTRVGRIGFIEQCEFTPICEPRPSGQSQEQ